MSTPWLTTQEAHMWRAFLAMQRDVARAVENQLKEHGLSGADYGILVTLSEAPCATLRIREIGDGIGWESSRLAHQLRRMEQRGLIERFNCPSDARGTLAKLTQLGSDTIAAAAPGHVETVRRHFVDLFTPDEMLLVTEIGKRVSTACAPASVTA